VSEPAWRCVCEPELATQLAGGDFSSELESAPTSPIDDYYGYVEHLLTLGSKQALDDSPTLGRLLLLGLVSGVESYFRSAIAGVLRTCPLSRRAAADQMIPFGAIDYYGLQHVELGLFDASSLAGASEIRKRTNSLLGIAVNPGTSLSAALDEFDKLCHLRHAAVHARGALGRGNASALALSGTAGRHALSVSFSGLQHAGIVCHSTVRAYNRAIYRRIVERWIGDGVLSGVWSRDKASFKALFDLFASKKDATGSPNAYQAHRSLSHSLLR
jgi:hypothetical protein